MDKVKIIFADKEQNNLNAFVAYFRRHHNYELACCLSSLELIEHLEIGIDILVVDEEILSIVGYERFAEPKYKRTVIIALTANRSLASLESAFSNGLIFKYHGKPFELDRLNESIEEAINAFF